jgi:methylated-DNA-[protein]-cysteine S-methyltransferase
MDMKQPFEQVVAQRGATVLRVCRVVLGPHDADDAWSETFLSAMRAYPDLPETAKRGGVARDGRAPKGDRRAASVEAEPAAGEGNAGVKAARRAADGLRNLRKNYPGANTRSTVMNDIRNDDDVPALLLTPVDADTLGRLRRRLEQGAEQAGLVDVAYNTIDSPLGRLLLAATPKGLVRVAYASESHDRVLQALSEKLSPRVLRAPKRLDDVAREIDDYFARRRRVFDLTLDLSLSRGFRQLVQMHLPEIGYGQTRSYRDVAELVGNPSCPRGRHRLRD